MANIRANLFFLAVFLISRTYGSVHESEGYAAILFDQSGISDNVYRDSYARNINDILRMFTEVGTTGVSVMSYGQYPLILLNCRETSSDMIMARDHFSTKLALLAPALKAMRYMFQECAGRSDARKSIYLIARKKVDDDSFLEVLREAEALKRSGVNIVTIFSYKNKMCLSELNKLSDEKKFQEGCCCEKTVLPEDIVDLGCPPKSATTEAQLTSTTKQEEFTTVKESEQVDGATHPPTIAKNSLIGTEDKPTALQQTQELVGPAVSPGLKGEPGVPGDRGSTGPDGPQGPQGRPGDAGPQGLKGDKGDVGEPGTLGYTGPAGPKGEPGLKGERGEAGVAGPPGVQGLKGEMGLTGPQGSRGEKGESGKAGDAGEPGPKGEVGPPGDMGDPGAIGAEGLPGLPGKEGERGLQGEPGNSGQPGPAGPQGPMGLKGDKGDQGPPGADGAPGRPGPAGAEGPMGPPGEAGVPGPCGPMGPRGKDGERGYKGSTGSTGPAGVQGPPGEAGPPGPGFFFEVTNDCSCNNASLCLSAYGLKYCLPPPTGCSHNNHGCHHICTDGQKGATCSCREGYVLGPDRKSCQDVDECQSKSLSCPFPLSCVNVIGSFHCLEIRGYDVIDHPGNFSKSILNFTKKFDWSFFLLVSILVSYLVIAVVVVWLIIASRSSRVRHQKLIRILRDQRADLDCSPSVSKV